MGNRLHNRTALVTGATSNLGKAIALAFGREGAHVVVHGRDEKRAIEVVDRIRAGGGKADFVLLELDGNPRCAKDLAERASTLLGGRIDVLVNNAGIFPPTTTPTTDEAMFDRVMGVNVKAPYFLTAAIAPGMAVRGSGVIINLGSWVARLGLPIGTIYSASKGALETLTRVWSAEFGPAGVRVVGISPGVMLEDMPADHPAAAMMRGTPAGGPGRATAVADAAVYLASDEASFVHGTILDVDGGRTSVAVISGAAASGGH
jgi:NAD(P)-dependent dehydrogenase (short-subunit alcohol dehydrogenase family)